MTNTAKTQDARVVTVDGSDVDVTGISRPEHLAHVLGVSAKVLRAYLRANYPRPVEMKGSTWTLDSDVSYEVAKYFTARRTSHVTTSADKA
jgi:hypothetical protein